MRSGITCCVLAIFTVYTGCKAPHASVESKPVFSVSPSGLGRVDIAPGEGSSPKIGQTCVIEAVGWVEEGGGKGTIILDTRKRGYPANFPFGVGRVIKGWDEGLATMKKGGKRLLRVPPPLGYSPAEAGHDIPAGATLLFEVELIDLR